MEVSDTVAVQLYKEHGTIVMARLRSRVSNPKQALALLKEGNQTFSLDFLLFMETGIRRQLKDLNTLFAASQAVFSSLAGLKLTMPNHVLRP